MKKPSNLEEFAEWFEKTQNVKLKDKKVERHYTTNVNNAFNAVMAHNFFVEFSNEAQNWERDYLTSTGVDLFMDTNAPVLATKPYSSAIDKLFRVNVLWNKKFPEPPSKGWINNQNMFAVFNDLVRGTLVCRFIDGPDFVASRITEFAERNGLYSRKYTQERDDGYYAYHVYVRFPVQILDIEWNEAQVDFEVEIQITTQLQEVLRSLTHKFYEQKRLLTQAESSSWKWDFKSNRFKVGYLSHTLHLLESIILDSRNAVHLVEEARTKDKNG